MRVLYLTMNPNRASTTVPTEGWFRLLRARGLEPTLVSTARGGFPEWAADQGVPCYTMPLPFPDRRHPIAFLTSLTRLTGISLGRNVDLVHCNEHEIYPIGQYAARLLGLPIVVSVHSTLRDGFSAWAFRGRRSPDRVLFVSHSSRAACLPDLGDTVPEDRQRVLPNGLDLDYYRPDPAAGAALRHTLGIGPGPILAAACALRPGKQVEHLFDALSRDACRSATLVLAGGPIPGGEAYAMDLIAHGRSLLGERFHHLGHQRDLRPLYNAAHLFVNTSREEAFGLTPLEALACGCPVVGYPSLAVAEVILPGGGEITPQDDVGSLSETLAAWMGSEARLQTARGDARRRAEAFDIRGIADTLWQDYESVLAERNGRRHVVPGAIGRDTRNGARPIQ